MSFLFLISSFLCGLKEGGISRGEVDGSGVGMYYTLWFRLCHRVEL